MSPTSSTVLGNATQNPLRICTSNEMRNLDEIAEKEFKIEPSYLMENAGRAATQMLLDRNPMAGVNSEILVFAGKGNNAGDAFVVARRLICLERRVRVFHLETEERYTGASRKNFEILRLMKAKLAYIEQASDLESFFRSSSGPYIVIDGLLGTGLKGDLDGVFFDTVEIINRLNAIEVLALDIPTGVSGDTGAIHGAAVQASVTLSFGFPKIGHFLPPGAGKRGELFNVDISLPPRFRREGDMFLLTRSPLISLVKQRDRYGHKNSFGHTLLIGGSKGRLGAVAMAARACHKMGTGLVTAGTWNHSFEALQQKLPNETMGLNLADYENVSQDFLMRELVHYSSVVVGPGLGKKKEAKRVLEELIRNYRGPMVLDADALNVIAEEQMHSLLAGRRSPTILTPHPGEMARLLGTTRDQVSADPVAALREAVKKTHSIVLLKGAATLISSPDDRIYLNHYPNDGMATAGSGDVLAGMIGGLAGQGIDPFQATLLGVYLHSLAGDFAAKQFGHRSMTAPDIIENIGNAFKEIKGSTESAVPVEHRVRLL